MFFVYSIMRINLSAYLSNINIIKNIKEFMNNGIIQIK